MQKYLNEEGLLELSAILREKFNNLVRTYLPLSGGTLTGKLNANKGLTVTGGNLEVKSPTTGETVFKVNKESGSVQVSGADGRCQAQINEDGKLSLYGRRFVVKKEGGERLFEIDNGELLVRDSSGKDYLWTETRSQTDIYGKYPYEAKTLSVGKNLRVNNDIRLFNRKEDETPTIVIDNTDGTIETQNKIYSDTDVLCGNSMNNPTHQLSKKADKSVTDKLATDMGRLQDIVSGHVNNFEEFLNEDNLISADKVIVHDADFGDNSVQERIDNANTRLLHRDVTVMLPNGCYTNDYLYTELGFSLLTMMVCTACYMNIDGEEQYQCKKNFSESVLCNFMEEDEFRTIVFEKLLFIICETQRINFSLGKESTMQFKYVDYQSDSSIMQIRLTANNIDYLLFKDLLEGVGTELSQFIYSNIPNSIDLVMNIYSDSNDEYKIEVLNKDGYKYIYYDNEERDYYMSLDNENQFPNSIIEYDGVDSEIDPQNQVLVVNMKRLEKYRNHAMTECKRALGFNF